MPAFKYTFQPEPEDLIAVNRMRFRPGRWAGISALIVLPLAAVMTALWIRNVIDTDELLALVTGLCFLPAYIIGLLAVKFLILAPRRCRRIFRQNQVFHHPITYELDEEALAITTLHGSGRVPWRDFYACRVNDAVIALFQSEAQCLMLPARIFASAEERGEVLALMARKVDRWSGQAGPG
jgi:hypothetical protein